MSEDKKQQLVNTSLQEMMRTLSMEAGEPCLAAVVVIQWSRDVTTGFSMAKMPDPTMYKRVLNLLARAMGACVDRIRNQIDKTTP